MPYIARSSAPRHAQLIGETHLAARMRIHWINAILILALLIGIYSLTYSGVPRVEDEQLIAARAQSLVLKHELGFPQLYGNDRLRDLAAIPQTEADIHAAVEPAESLLAAIPYRIGLFLNVGGTQAAMLTNLYLTALTGAVIYLSLIADGYRRLTALTGALAFGLGTMAWPYSKTLFRDVFLMFCTSVTILGITLLPHRNRRIRLTGSLLICLTLLAGLLTKRTAWALVFALGASTLIRESARCQPNKKPISTLVTIAVGTGVMALIAALIPPHGLLARYSLQHFIYALARMLEGVGNETLPAFLGPFLSPGKSIFLFSPVLLLAPYGFARGWRSRRRLYTFGITTILALTAMQALFYRDAWAGIPIWGLRFMLLTLPLLTIFCAPIIEDILQTGRSAHRSIAVMLMGWSGFTQIAGAAVAWHEPLLEWYRRGFDPYLPGSMWKFTGSPIPFHISALLKGVSLDPAWTRLTPEDPRAFIVPLLAGGIALLCAGLLCRVNRAPSRRKPAMPWAITITALAVIVPFAPNLALLEADPAAGGRVPGYRESIAWVLANAHPADPILVDSYGTPLWHAMMNQWVGGSTWYSLPYRLCVQNVDACSEDEAYASAARNLLDSWSTLPGRVWYLSSHGSSPVGDSIVVILGDYGYERVRSETSGDGQAIEFRLASMME